MRHVGAALRHLGAAIFSPDDRPHEWEILIRLGAILAGIPAADVAEMTTFRGPDRIVDLTVRMSPWGDGYGARPGGLRADALTR